jgi:MOSC domain-containing protein YiiM
MTAIVSSRASVSIERIFIRPPGGDPTVEQQSVRVVAGAGIEGDRYFGVHDEPGQNVTFVEAEAIEAFSKEHRRRVDLSATGRNVVTRGVRLNELVGREFVVGSVRFRGVELCEPCLTLGEALASPTLSPARVVKHWAHRGGLRADALTSGELSVGSGFGNAA